MTEYLKSLPPIISVAKTAELLGVSVPTAYRYVKTGDLPTITLNNRMWVRTQALVERLLTDAEVSS